MTLLAAVIGFVVGVIVAAWIFIWVMRNKFVVVRKARGTFDEVCQRLEKAVEESNGWHFPVPTWEFYQSQTKAGFKFGNIRNLKKYFICKSPHANAVVNDRALWSAFLPCTWSVYEDMNGQVYIAELNLPLMSLVMPGVLGRVLKEVVKEEDEMLKKATGE